MSISVLTLLVPIFGGPGPALAPPQEGAQYGGAKDEAQEFWMPFLQRAQELSLSQEPISPEIRDELSADLRAALAGRNEDTPWSRLARAYVSLLGGEAVDEVAGRLGNLEPWPYPAQASWHAAVCLPQGPLRVQAIEAGLSKAGALERWEQLLAWNTAVEEARVLRFREGSLGIQRELHRRYAAVWSAMDLALTLRQLNEQEECDALVAQAIERAHKEGQPTVGLWSQRGINALGFGDEARGRDYLGRALAMGSNDASIVLGRLDLVSGRIEAARAAFRGSILSDPEGAWAQRGWGLSLLPRPKTPPAGLRAKSPLDQ